MGYLYYLLAFVFGLVCVLLMLLILIQKGRGGGLSAAFGGAGGNTAFGAKTGDMLTWVTAAFFGVFIILSVAMVWSTNYLHANSIRAAPVVLDETTPSTGAADGAAEGAEAAPAPAEPLEAPPADAGTQPSQPGGEENPQ